MFQHSGWQWLDGRDVEMFRVWWDAPDGTYLHEDAVCSKDAPDAMRRELVDAARRRLTHRVESWGLSD